MKIKMSFILLVFQAHLLSAGIVEKTFYFNNYIIESNGIYQTVNFGNTILSGIPGEPLLPWCQIVLMLPPGEAARSLEVVEEEETVIPGQFLIYPKQNVRPISKGKSGEFIRNDEVYNIEGAYPVRATGQLLTQYLNGYAFALSAFTPVRYNPGMGQLSYFGKVTVRITTQYDERSEDALNNFSMAENSVSRAKSFAMNPEMMNQYPKKYAPTSTYEYLIISPANFKNEFQPLISMYGTKGISARVVTIDSITSVMSGYDIPEKMRNFIKTQRTNHQIQYVLLAGNPPLVPCRGFYCHVHSGGSIYEDYNIPADLYFSGLDGNYDGNGNHVYGEEADAVDLLPDIAVGRFTVNDTAELHRMIHKTIYYQTNPVLGEMNKPLLAGEFLYSAPMTFGGSYMNLLINNRSDNGYFTYGIPSAGNSIEKLYDTLISPPSNVWSWSAAMLLASINRGKSFIHHLGHANSVYMMRFSMSSITNANFSGVNGIIHNYQLLYTQGCDCGAFDVSGGCIAAKAVSISNFLAAGICNSRYGWFDEGTTEGPSEHLEREFVSALYDATLPEKHMGTAHMISKIKTAVWVGLPAEFEPGAQRWCHYDCNLFGDPAMEIWTGEPTTFSENTWTGNIDSNWNNPGNWSTLVVPTTLNDITISGAAHYPVITTGNTTFCHNLNILSGGNLIISPGKSMIVYGSVTLSP